MKTQLAFLALLTLAGTVPAAVFTSSSVTITVGNHRPAPPPREVIVVQEPEPDVIVVQEAPRHCPPRVVYVREHRHRPVVVYTEPRYHHGYVPAYQRPTLVRRATPWDRQHEPQRASPTRDTHRDHGGSGDRSPSRERGGDQVAEGPRGR